MTDEQRIASEVLDGIVAALRGRANLMRHEQRCTSIHHADWYALQRSAWAADDAADYLDQDRFVDLAAPKHREQLEKYFPDRVAVPSEVQS